MVLVLQVAGRVPRGLLVWGLLATIIAVAGPFGTYDTMPMQARLLLWLILIAIAIPMSWGFRYCVDRWLDGHPAKLRSVVVALIFALTFAPLVYSVMVGLQVRGLAQVVPVWQMGLVTFLSAWSVCIVRTYLGDYAGAPDPQIQPDHADVVAPSDPRLLTRLPPEARGALRAISVRDHYVDVHTEKGTASLLLRLSDAIAEVGSVPGAQVHRSHWVAWAAVSGVERAQGGLVLRLVCGCRIPVSRANRAKLEAQGLISQRVSG